MPYFRRNWLSGDHEMIIKGKTGSGGAYIHDFISPKIIPEAREAEYLLGNASKLRGTKTQCRMIRDMV